MVNVAARELAGRTVLVLRAHHQSAGLVAALRAAGAVPIEAAAIAIKPPERWDALDVALAGIATYDWMVFASANAVDAVASRLERLIPPPDFPALRIGAVGPATAGAAAARFGHVHFVPSVHTGEVLAEELPIAPAARVLLPGAELARPELRAGLVARGATVDAVTAYRTIADPGLGPALEAMPRPDAVMFTSPSSVDALVVQLASAAPSLSWNLEDPGRPVLACIGPSTAAAAYRAALPVDVVAETHSVEALVSTLARWWASHG